MITRQSQREAFSSLLQRFADGAPDVKALSDEQRAWIELTIQALANVDAALSIANQLQKMHNRVASATEDLPLEELQGMVSYIFNHKNDISKLL